MFAVSMVLAKTTIKVIMKKRKLSLQELNSDILDVTIQFLQRKFPQKLFVGDCYGMPDENYADKRLAFNLFCIIYF